MQIEQELEYLQNICVTFHKKSEIIKGQTS